jgi:hypothetical protein
MQHNIPPTATNLRSSRPKTFLVPEKDRTPIPPAGLFRWIIPVLKTPNAVLISKCGLDAYFFLRFLRMLLKIFIPSSIVVLPILIPINNTLKNKAGIRGLDTLGWQNYDPAHTDRLWAHLILAVLVLTWTCYVIYDELRGYIRVRQAYLTSPQHRLRASATTVLVTAIPRKWLTYEALDGLYDVFPGGIRNIWINRDFDELNEKVKERDKLALMLEGAETELIRKAKKKYVKIQEKKEKDSGRKYTKSEQTALDAKSDADALEMADQPGLSSGNPHQAHTVDEALGDVSDGEELAQVQSGDKARLPLEALGRGVDTLKGGLGVVGHGITGFGKRLVGGVTEAPKNFNDRVDRAYEGAGFAYDGSGEEPMADPGRGRAGTLESQRSVDSQRRRLVPTQSIPARPSADAAPTAKIPASGHVGIDSSLPEVRIDQSNLRGTGTPLPAVHHPDHSQDSTSSPIEKNPYNPSPPRPSKGPGRVDWTNNGFLQEAPSRGWKIWQDSHGIAMPSPEPKEKEDAELKAATAIVEPDKEPVNVPLSQKLLGLFSKGKGDEESIEEVYPDAYNEQYVDDSGGETEPEWKKYLSEGDRGTKRLPLFSWMPYLPSWTFIGKKVDTIYYCRKELARLNLEIEQDQQEPEKFPLMNSAFIQFNHQIAAHMACQSVSHHVPNQMAPRTVEIAPGDIIWDNLSVKWWERFIRQGVVVVLIAGLIIAWAVPISATGFISNLDNLQASFDGKPFGWIGHIPKWLKSGIQGVLPAVFIAILFALLPIILRFAAKQQGVPTGMSVELKVQNYYFAFSFVQLFLIVTISKSLIDTARDISNNPTSVTSILATNVPKASNFFFSYLLLQAFTISAGSLAQVMELVKWFIFRPILDNTARQKFQRQLSLPEVKWGTFFPVYTNLACIGLIFSVIAPLVMIFNIITFSMFWVAYRYQTLYVSTFKFDTGGLLFPTAVNQLFTGIYVMEIALIGLFSVVRDTKQSKTTCLPQLIIMVICLIFTILYHFLLNYTFSPLYRYMPITLEDDAVRRDEEFERAHSKRWEEAEGNEEEDIEDRLERQEHQEELDEKNAEALELENIKKRHSNHLQPTTSVVSRMGTTMLHPRQSWADRSRNRRSSRKDAGALPHSPAGTSPARRRSSRPNHRISMLSTSTAPLSANGSDLENGGKSAAPRKHPHTAAVGDALFGSFNDEIEDLTPEERDFLVQRAFQHEALRARRPVVWIPRDDLGIADDEIRRTQAFSDNIWISNEFTGLDRKARVVYRRAPPDFSEVDLIEL